MDGYFVRILLFVCYLWYNGRIQAAEERLGFVGLCLYSLV